MSIYINKLIDIPKRTISYYVNKAEDLKECIFLLGGYINVGEKFWINQYRDKELNQNYKIITIDYFNSGNSKEKEDKEYDMKELVDTIDLVITTEKCDKVILVGFSFGSNVALSYAKYYRNKVSCMILFAPTFHIERKYRRVLFAVQEMLSRGCNLETVLYVLAPWGYTNTEYEIIHANEGDNIRRLSENETTSGLIRRIKLIQEINLVDTVKENDVPTCLVTGKYDDISPLMFQEKLHSYLINSTLIVLESGHAVGLQDTKFFNSIIKKQISKLIYE